MTCLPFQIVAIYTMFCGAICGQKLIFIRKVEQLEIGLWKTTRSSYRKTGSKCTKYYSSNEMLGFSVLFWAPSIYRSFSISAAHVLDKFERIDKLCGKLHPIIIIKYYPQRETCEPAVSIESFFYPAHLISPHSHPVRILYPTWVWLFFS